ncbi:MAG: hypothetical protein ACOYL6_05785 [Bacteriovoracaceae bacterium]
MLKILLLSSVLTLSAGFSNAYALEIHEWGTFTSMVNEKGGLLSGMNHEEVGLPGFVYGLRHDGPAAQNSAAQLALKNGSRPHCFSKCSFFGANDPMADVIPFNQFNTTVTQKMETPVIYFYGAKGEQVHVEVSFPDGMISQWFPAASKFNSHLEEFNNGFMQWDVTLKDPSETSLYPRTSDNSIWNPARLTSANTIQTSVNGTEEERFIFYRGLADFKVPLQIKMKNKSATELLVTLTNNSDQAVPALFYLKSTYADGVTNFLSLPTLKPHETKSFLTSNAQNLKSAKNVIQAALIQSGLFEDEALSMLNTWDQSYFHTEGERILYLLPTEWTEKILPMKLSPVPQKLVRTLVGRIELFSDNAQLALINKIDKNTEGLLVDRLLEPKLRAIQNKLLSSKVTDLLTKAKLVE